MKLAFLMLLGALLVTAAAHFTCAAGRMRSFLSLLLFALILVNANPQETSTDMRHWIEEVSSSGSVLILEDNSVWAVQTIDRVKTSIWLPVDDIQIVKTSDNQTYPYLLVDTREHKTAHAKYLGKI